MNVRQPRYSKEEFARRGNVLYEAHIRPRIEMVDWGKVVAINIDTGAFEVDDTPIVATNRLYERYPNGQLWVIRIGDQFLYRFGSRSLK